MNRHCFLVFLNHSNHLLAYSQQFTMDGIPHIRQADIFYPNLGIKKVAAKVIAAAKNQYMEEPNFPSIANISDAAMLSTITTIGKT